MMTNVHIFTFLLLIVALFATSFAFPTANTDDPLIAFEAQTTKEHSKNDTETGASDLLMTSMAPFGDRKGSDEIGEGMEEGQRMFINRKQKFGFGPIDEIEDVDDSGCTYFKCGRKEGGEKFGKALGELGEEEPEIIGGTVGLKESEEGQRMFINRKQKFGFGPIDVINKIDKIDDAVDSGKTYIKSGRKEDGKKFGKALGELAEEVPEIIEGIVGKESEEGSATEKYPKKGKEAKED